MYLHPEGGGGTAGSNAPGAFLVLIKLNQCFLDNHFTGILLYCVHNGRV